MSVRIAFRGMEHSPVMEEFALKHLEKVQKVLENEETPVYLDLVLTAAPTRAHNRVELLVKTPHYELVAHHEGAEMYQEIDRVTDIMVKEIRKAKEKRVDYVKQHNKDKRTIS